MSHWHWSCSAGGYSAAAVYAGVLQYDVWLWNMLDIHCPCLFNHLLWSEKPPFESKGKQCDFRHGSILWFSLQPLLHHQNPPFTLSSWGRGTQRGTVSVYLWSCFDVQTDSWYFQGTMLNCGRPAELCGEPPVSYAAWLFLLSRPWRCGEEACTVLLASGHSWAVRTNVHHRRRQLYLTQFAVALQGLM